jgi:hypothetical protein
MTHSGSRTRRALAVIGVLLLIASSAQAAISFERPGPKRPDRDELAAAESPGASAPDSERVAASGAHPVELESGVAPRIGESRQPAEARLPTGSLATPSRELAADGRAERLLRRSRPGEIARWCLAHATSTQAP